MSNSLNERMFLTRADIELYLYNVNNALHDLSERGIRTPHFPARMLRAYDEQNTRYSDGFMQDALLMRVKLSDVTITPTDSRDIAHCCTLHEIAVRAIEWLIEDAVRKNWRELM